MNYKLIFSIEIFAFLLLSFMAVAVEGPSGGIFGRNLSYGISGDIWLSLSIVLFILIPIVVRGFKSKLIGTLLVGAFVGLILEDFFWFIINPNFGLNKFSPEFATWLTWYDFGYFKIPTFYLLYAVIAFIVWLVFIKNSRKIDKWYRLAYHTNR